MTTTQITPGAELKRWRTHRRLSQLDLSVTAYVSQRHLSFLETGRAKPSREMIIHLATVLNVPLRDRNTWLYAAGYAAVYSEHGLGEPAMEEVRHALELILEAHSPFPAYVVDRAWTLVMTNQPAAALTSMMVSPQDAPLFGGNILRLLLHPKGLRASIINWESAGAALLSRLEREVADRPGDEVLADLLTEVMAYPDVGELRHRPEVPTGADLLVSLDMKTPVGDMRLLTTIATIGAPFDITLEELRLETLLPADRKTEALLRKLTE